MQGRRAGVAVLVLGVGFGFGCGSPVLSEEEQLSATVPGLGGTLSCPGVPTPVLVGAEIQAAVACFGDCPEGYDALACFSTDLEPTNVAPGVFRYTFDREGPVTWRFDAVPCPANEVGYRPVDDRFRFEAVGPDDITAEPGAPEAFAEALLSPGPRGSFPDDWQQPAGEPWQLVVDRPFRFAPAFVTDDGRLVGVPSAALTLTVEQARGQAAEVFADDQGGLVVPRALGETGTVWLSHPAAPGARWPLATFVAVPEQAVASLEVVAAYRPAGTDGGPIAARAIARDARGRLVWGAPVGWTVEGEGLSLDLAPPVGGAIYAPRPTDHVTIRVDGAAAAPGPHSGRLTATVGDHTAAAELAWTAPEAPAAPDWPVGIPVWYCPPGGGGGFPVWPALGAVVLLGAAAAGLVGARRRS